MTNFCQIFFPALMIIGAFGSLITNIIIKGNIAVSIQWFGATFLYTGLLIRNIK